MKKIKKKTIRNKIMYKKNSNENKKILKKLMENLYDIFIQCEKSCVI